jgi:hypothetical protein
LVILAVIFLNLVLIKLTQTFTAGVLLFPTPAAVLAR